VRETSTSQSGGNDYTLSYSGILIIRTSKVNEIYFVKSDSSKNRGLNYSVRLMGEDDL